MNKDSLKYIEEIIKQYYSDKLAVNSYKTWGDTSELELEDITRMFDTVYSSRSTYELSAEQENFIVGIIKNHAMLINGNETKKLNSILKRKQYTYFDKGLLNEIADRYRNSIK